MALKAVPIWVCANYSNTQVGFADSGSNRSGSGPNLRLDLERFRKWECCGVLAQREITPVEDGKPVTPEFDSPGANDETQITESRGFHKDLNSLPRPLTATDLSSSASDGSKVRVAYQGVPGAYSEAAALKAYPKCETVPCDQFEAAFKAVELWLVDRAVLPIENSVGGSIHRNYDLLLRHRLHIVGEVQLVVNHCLLGLRGVRKEELKRVLSHPQALAQCEMTLNKLGVVKVNADDTAGAALIVAANGQRDTGTVASARAAEIYGLDILAERIQIESRPQRKRPLRVVDDSNKGSAKYFDYLFYIDFEASMAEPRAQYALTHLQFFLPLYTWLSYGFEVPIASVQLVQSP
ncbi:arogenate dehydratase 1 [Actinidia rufa]|uniref:arogenate dehydratase n=1 Tax=Actinidia rufa TaxID=165716 RepID=A0A7J0FZ82_9ERIC|nr:arogenate dehydratase 1 [Actinidia rufa]